MTRFSFLVKAKTRTLKTAGCGTRPPRCSTRYLGIRDFAEDGRPFGAGGGGEIGGAVVKGFVAEEGEGVGFFGLFGDVEVSGRKDINGVV